MANNEARKPYDNQCFCPRCKQEIDLTKAKANVQGSTNNTIFDFMEMDLSMICDKCGISLFGVAYFLWDYQADMIKDLHFDEEDDIGVDYID